MARGPRHSTLLSSCVASFCLLHLLESVQRLSSPTSFIPVAQPRCCPTRRSLVSCITSVGAAQYAPHDVSASALVNSSITVALKFERGAFYLNYDIDGLPYRGVVDTGSPFAIVSACGGERLAQGRCEEYCVRYGCGTATTGQATDLEDNVVVVTGARNMASWRQGSITVGGVKLPNIKFGVLTETQSYGGNAGGPNFGLIRMAAADPAIRPTFLAQTPYGSFAINLKTPGSESLHFSQNLDFSAAVQLPIVDLRSYGAPVVYYALKLRALKFDGVDVVKGEDVVAIIDSGTTGLTLPLDLFDEYDRQRRLAAAKASQEQRYGVAAYGNVELVCMGLNGNEQTLKMRRGSVAEYGGARFDVVTAIPFAAGGIFYREEKKRPDVKRPRVIFAGLGFLLGRQLSVDASVGVMSIA